MSEHLLDEMFKTTDEDLKVGDLVRVWSHIIYQDHYKKGFRTRNCFSLLSSKCFCWGLLVIL